MSEKSEPISTSNDGLYKVYPGMVLRVALAGGAALFANGLAATAFPRAVAACTEDVYEVVGSAVGQVLAVAYLLSFPFGLWGAARLSVGGGGPRAALLAGAALTAAAAACRWAGLWLSPPHTYYKYNSALVSQILLGLGAPFLLVPVVRRAALWLGPGRRDDAATRQWLAYQAGLVAGPLLSALLLGGGGGVEPGGVVLGAACGPARFHAVYAAEGAAAAAALALALLAPAGPPSPPSLSQADAWRERVAALAEEEGEGDAAGALLGRHAGWLARNWHYRFLLASGAAAAALAQGVVFGTAETRVGGYEAAAGGGGGSGGAAAAALPLLAYWLGGAGAAPLAGAALAAQGYHPTRKVLLLLLIPVIILFQHETGDGTVDSTQFPGLGELGAYFLLGGVLLPLVPICLETAAEITHGVAEELSSGLILAAGSPLAVAVYAILGGEARHANPDAWAASSGKIYVTAFAVAAAAFGLLTYGFYKRTSAEFAENTIRSTRTASSRGGKGGSREGSDAAV